MRELRPGGPHQDKQKVRELRLSIQKIISSIEGERDDQSEGGRPRFQYLLTAMFSCPDSLRRKKKKKTVHPRTGVVEATQSSTSRGLTWLITRR
jgi:hypothetical protein